jgi:uncharacterized membrane protein YccC
MVTLRRQVRRAEAATLRLLQSDRAALLLIVKATFASAVAFELARTTVGSTVPALAAMAAIITVQVSGSRTVRRALEYSAGVVAGVIVAILLTRFLGVHWWSISLLVLLSLFAGRIIRLGSQANQIAISALLVMSLGSSYGWTRVSDTLIGAAVGVATSVAVPPPSLERTVRNQIASAATELSLAIRGMSAGVGAGWSAADVRDALGSARVVSQLLVEPRASVEAERDERRLSLASRRRGGARSLDRCDAALTALDHVTNEVRSVGRSVLAMSTKQTAVSESERADLGGLLDALAQVVADWGTAAGADDATPHLDRLLNARDQLTAKCNALRDLNQPASMEPQWIAMLLEIERIVGELNPAGAHGAAIASCSNVGRGDERNGGTAR